MGILCIIFMSINQEFAKRSSVMKSLGVKQILASWKKAMSKQQ